MNYLAIDWMSIVQPLSFLQESRKAVQSLPSFIIVYSHTNTYNTKPWKDMVYVYMGYMTTYTNFQRVVQVNLYVIYGIEFIL